MSLSPHPGRFSLCLALSLALALAPGASPSRAQTTNHATYPIDLPATLRLAGARNLDVQIARERLKEAEANRTSALEQFFPWAAAGVSYHRRDGLAQSVPSGVVSDANFQSYSPGATVAAQMDLGDAIYKSLAAKQLVKASDHALAAQRLTSEWTAAGGYFDLAESASLVAVVVEALKTSQDYQRQLHEAVASGIVFKGDELRVQSQTEHYEIELQQALERQRVAAATLAQTLHLDPKVELVPPDQELAPLALFPTNALLATLVDQALASRPELKQSRALLAASRAARDGAIYGPLIPSLGAQGYGGGLGGGPDNGPGNFGPEGDVFVGASWRIGPGGLFDSGRINAAKARLAAAQFGDSKLGDAIAAEVVSAFARLRSTAAQIEIARRSLATTAETLRLTHQRKQYGVGIVLEDILAQQALTQARSDYFTAVAGHNKAQYDLNKATGGPRDPSSTRPR